MREHPHEKGIARRTKRKKKMTDFILSLRTTGFLTSDGIIIAVYEDGG